MANITKKKILGATGTYLAASNFDPWFIHVQCHWLCFKGNVLGVLC